MLPLIRSRSRDLWRYSVANEHGVQMLDGAALLEQAIRHPQSLNIYGVVEPTPDETYKVAHKALASAIRVIARADDSAGIIGDACRQLIDLHAQAAAQATVSPTKLADWIFDFHFDDQVDYFELDPVAYAPALGPKGLDRLRARVDALRGEIPPHDPDDRLAHYDHREFLVRWFDKRFAVLDRDFDAIIHTHLRDGRVAAWYEDVAAAFDEIGEIDLAIDWSEQATLFDHGHQSQQAARRWQRLLEQHRPQDLPDAVRVVFGRWPSAGAGARVIETSGAGLIPDVQETLLSRPAELVRFQLETMADPASPGRPQPGWKSRTTDSGPISLRRIWRSTPSPRSACSCASSKAHSWRRTHAGTDRRHANLPPSRGPRQRPGMRRSPS